MQGLTKWVRMLDKGPNAYCVFFFFWVAYKTSFRCEKGSKRRLNPRDVLMIDVCDVSRFSLFNNQNSSTVNERGVRSFAS